MKFDDVFNDYFADLDNNVETGFPINIDNVQSIVNDVYFVDSGYNYVFNSSKLKIIFFKAGYVNIANKKTKSQSVERYFCIMTESDVVLYKVLNYNNFNFEVTKVSLDLNFNFNFDNVSIEQSVDLTNNMKVDMVRRYLELNIVESLVSSDCFVVLDGALVPYYDFEKSILDSILSKSSNVLGFSKKTNFNVILKKFSYVELDFKYTQIKSILAKIHPESNYVFRVDFIDLDKSLKLLYDSIDNIFIGYPYGLLLVDKLMKVSDHDKQIVSSILYHNCKNKELFENLNNQTNAHDFIDLINFS